MQFSEETYSTLMRMEMARYRQQGRSVPTGLINGYRRLFGWTIPSRAMIDLVVRHGPVLEVGSGCGHITALLRKRRVEVVAVDDFSWGIPPYLWIDDTCPTIPHRADGYVGYSLLLCRPPFEGGMAASALGQYRGNHVFHVGLDPEDDMRDLEYQTALQREWRIERTMLLLRWPGDAYCLYHLTRNA